jgi:hypothetical protein
VVISRAATEKEVVDAANKKATNVVAARKTADVTVATERATVDKRATYVTMAEKVADDAAVAERATVEVATPRVPESSPALAVGAKRAAVSGGYTPPTKRPFHDSWKPRFVEGFRSCSSFFHVYFVSLGFLIV